MGKLGAIVVCCDINEETNNETVKMVHENGGMGFGYVCDVSMREQVEAVAKAIRYDARDKCKSDQHTEKFPVGQRWAT